MCRSASVAEIGEDRTRFPEPAALLAEAGLAPVTRASGRSRSVRFRYAANTHLREAAMWWAFNSLKTSPWAASAFRQARDQRGQRYHRAPPRPRRPLDADSVAMLDQPHHLQPPAAPRRAAGLRLTLGLGD